MLYYVIFKHSLEKVIFNDIHFKFFSFLFYSGSTIIQRMNSKALKQTARDLAMHHLQILSPSEQGRIHIFESLILLWIVWKFAFGDTEDQKQKVYGVAYATYVEPPKQEDDIDSFGICGLRVAKIWAKKVIHL
jgi:hypothetical protein